MSLFSSSALLWLETILQERFGHAFSLRQQGSTLLLSLPRSKSSICFDKLQCVFHQQHSDFLCTNWRASVEGYIAPIEDFVPAPSESELPSPLIEVHKQGATVHYDLLGLTYWMLTRLEEVGRKDLDNHQRFSATASHAYKHDYLERPIVDEWLSILGQVMQRVWPQLRLKQHKFSIKVSHDVDSPSLYAFKPWSTIGRMMAGHLFKRRDFKAFITAPYVKLAFSTRLHPADPFNTFDWLMDVSEANNLKSAFYFICGRTDKARDADYEPDHPVIRSLMGSIHERGHEIGLHPSYGTYQKPELIRQEALRLKRICAEEGIEQSMWGGRMHYLRWEHPTTLRAWVDAGMDYDSTLGYADRPGFRCGTCFDYPAFDPIAQQMLTLRVHPLVMMECTVIDSIYLGLGVTEAAVEKVRLLKSRCQQLGGCFTILWHNSYLSQAALREMYMRIVS